MYNYYVITAGGCRAAELKIVALSLLAFMATAHTYHHERGFLTVGGDAVPFKYQDQHLLFRRGARSVQHDVHLSRLHLQGPCLTPGKQRKGKLRTTRTRDSAQRLNHAAHHADVGAMRD